MSIIKFIADFEKALKTLDVDDFIQYPELSMLTQGLQMLLNKIKNVVPEKETSYTK